MIDPAQWEGKRSAALVAVLAATLLAGAIYNGFPLIFPDSGTYLGIAFGHQYAIDRASTYGFLIKPIVSAVGGLAGMWIAIAVQAALVAAIVAAVARMLVPAGAAPFLLAPLLLLTSAPWHAGQFMPDAFTAPLVLTVWIAARRDLAQPGTLLLWALAGVLAAVHYTHVVLLAATGIAVVATDAIAGLPRGPAIRRATTVIVAAALTAAALAGANAMALKRWSVSPLGPVFLFARLNEDGLIPRWFDAHCGRDAPVELCAERARMAPDSQVLLWRDPDGIVSRHIWQSAAGERWRWAAMMDAANRGAIADEPLAFLASSARGAWHQFTSFALLDDECPENCRGTRSGIGFSLARHRPGTEAVLAGSRQGRGTLPKAALRAATTPIAALAIVALPVLLVLGWRRRDSAVTTLAGGTLIALVVNATLAGALSDVHDRYQSRLVWLAPLILLLAILRWRKS